MAIIYTYPVKSGIAADSDLIVISDSADKNKTKQISISQLPGGSSAGVSQIIAGTGGITISPSGGTGAVTINVPSQVSIATDATDKEIPVFNVTGQGSPDNPTVVSLGNSHLGQKDRGIEVLASNTPTPGTSGTEIVLGEDEKPGGSIVVGSTLSGTQLTSADPPLTSTVITAINTNAETGLVSYTLANAVELNGVRVRIGSETALVQFVTQRPTSGIENSGTITGTVGTTSGLTTSSKSGSGATVSVVTNSSGSVDDLTIQGATLANGYAVGDTITGTSTFLPGANQSLIVTLKNTSFVEQVGGVSYPPTEPAGLYYPTFRLTNTTQASGPFSGGPSPGFGWKNDDVVGSFEIYTTDGSTPGPSPVSYVRSKITLANQYYPVSGLSFGITRWDTATPRFEQGANLEAMSLGAYYTSAAPYVYTTNANGVTIGSNLGNRLTINSGRSDTTDGKEIIQQSSLRFLSQSLQTEWPENDSVLSIIDTYTEDGTKTLSYIKTVSSVSGATPNGELIFGTATQGNDATTKMRLNDDGKLEITGSISVTGDYIDSTGSSGTNSQYLTSKGSGGGTIWSNGPSGSVTKVLASAGMFTSPSTGITTTGTVGLNYATSGENPNYIKVASSAEAAANSDVFNVSRSISGVDTVVAVSVGSLPFNNSTFTAGNGLTLTGNVFSLTTPITPADGGTGLTNISTLLNSNINYTTDGAEGSILPVIHGGTGNQTFNSYGILYGNNSNAIGSTTFGTTGQVLIAQGNDSPPIWGDASSSGSGTTIVAGSSGTSSGLTTALVVNTSAKSNETTITSNSYNGGDAVGHVPSGGTNAQVYLDGTGNWSVPGGEGGGGVTGIIVGSNTVTGGITFAGAVTQTGNTITFSTTSTAYTASQGIRLVDVGTGNPEDFQLTLTTSSNYILAAAITTTPNKNDIIAYSPSRGGAANDNVVNKTSINNLVDSYFTGTSLPISKGGSGATSFINNQVLLTGTSSSTGSGNFTTPGSGTSGQVLTSNGSAAPTWQTASGGGGSGTVVGVGATSPLSITGTASVNPVVNLTGNIPVTNLAGAANASSSTFWRGDGSWATPASSSGGITRVNVTSPITGGGNTSTVGIAVNTFTGGANIGVVPAAPTEQTPPTLYGTIPDAILTGTGSWKKFVTSFVAQSKGTTLTTNGTTPRQFNEINTDGGLTASYQGTVNGSVILKLTAQTGGNVTTSDASSLKVPTWTNITGGGNDLKSSIITAGYPGADMQGVQIAGLTNDGSGGVTNNYVLEVSDSNSSFGAPAVVMIQSAVAPSETYGGPRYVVFKSGSSGTVSGGIKGGSTASATPSFFNSSDYRLKTNINSYHGGLEKISNLRPVTYEEKANLGQVVEGFIAHEVQEHIPKAVNGVKDAIDENGEDIIQTLSIGDFMVDVVSAIKELKDEVDSLKAEIRSLKK